MSQHDNLQDADGENLNATPPNTESTENTDASTEHVKQPILAGDNSEESDEKTEKEETKVALPETEISSESKEENSEKSTEDESSEDEKVKDESAENNSITKATATNSEETMENLSLEELVDKFDSLLDNENTQNVRNSINKIKTNFNAKFTLLIAEKKEAFLADGGNVIDFNFTSPLKKRFNDLSKDFREKQQ